MLLCRALLLSVIASGAFADVVSSQDSPAGMVLIPSGEFTMGRTFETADDKRGMRPLVLRDGRPAHRVRPGAYFMDAHEVTQAQYAEFVKSTGHRTPYHWLDGVRKTILFTTSIGKTLIPTAPGGANGFRPKQSGIVRRAAAKKPNATHGVTTSRTASGRFSIHRWVPGRPVLTPPIHSACMTWRGVSPSGVRTGSRGRITSGDRRRIPRGPQRGCTRSSGVAPGRMGRSV